MKKTKQTLKAFIQQHPETILEWTKYTISINESLLTTQEKTTYNTLLTQENYT